jgi:predicted nucleotidyltransferase
MASAQPEAKREGLSSGLDPSPRRPPCYATCHSLEYKHQPSSWQAKFLGGFLAGWRTKFFRHANTRKLSGKFSAVAEFSHFSEYIRMSVAELPIRIDREQIARFCRERGIRKLSLFGSVLRPDFDPQRSDVDVLAEFEPGVLKNAGFQYFGYAEELAAIIGRKVDFCSRLHPLILGRVKDELFPVYECRGSLGRARC